MNEGPYRTPGEIPQVKPTIFERIAANKAATGFTGAITITLVILTCIAIVEIPGMLLLYAVTKLEGEPFPQENIRYLAAAAFTGMMAGGGYFTYKIVRGFGETAFAAGEFVLEYIELYLERRRR
jgi:hypothetical protein